jgi:hypothetical protein
MITEAWSLPPSNDMEIIMFMDNEHRLAGPCSSTEDTDRSLMQRLHIFYDLIRIGGGIFEFLGTRSSQRIDIVEVSFGVKVLSYPWMMSSFPNLSKMTLLANVSDLF